MYGLQFLNLIITLLLKQDEVFKNKLGEKCIIVRNKARLVAKGYNQEEFIYYDETFTPITKLEAIQMLLTFACTKNFKLFQMDVKVPS